MRNLVIGICSFAFFLLLILVGYTVTAREKRQTELEQALNLAMEQTMRQLEFPDAYSPENDEEFVAMFEQQLLAQLTAEADYEIGVLDVDSEKGLLSVEVTESFSHLNGRLGTIRLQKMIVLDREADGQVQETRQLTFWVGEQIYRRYELTEGSPLVVPGTPYIESGTFAGWRSQEDGKLYTEEILSGFNLTEDLSFTAEIE